MSEKLISQVRWNARSVLKLADPGVEVGEQIQHMVSDDAVSLFGWRRMNSVIPRVASLSSMAP